MDEKGRSMSDSWVEAPDSVVRPQPPFKCEVCGHHEAFALRVHCAHPSQCKEAAQRLMLLVDAWADATMRGTDNVCAWCALRFNLADEPESEAAE